MDLGSLGKQRALQLFITIIHTSHRDLVSNTEIIKQPRGYQQKQMLAGVHVHHHQTPPSELNVGSVMHTHLYPDAGAVRAKIAE